MLAILIWLAIGLPVVGRLVVAFVGDSREKLSMLWQLASRRLQQITGTGDTAAGWRRCRCQRLVWPHVRRLDFCPRRAWRVSCSRSDRGRLSGCRVLGRLHGGRGRVGALLLASPVLHRRDGCAGIDKQSLLPVPLLGDPGALVHMRSYRSITMIRKRWLGASRRSSSPSLAESGCWRWRWRPTLGTGSFEISTFLAIA